ncbi:hypothetical protein A2U01_0056565, partial [Trifolium medium]|nr:hypothetical protein [Trifolium medium]
EKEELTLRMGDKEQFIHIQKGKKDWCCRIDIKEKDPVSQGWRMKVSLEELEEGLAELKMEEQPCPDLDMNMLDIKEENIDGWTKR